MAMHQLNQHAHVLKRYLLLDLRIVQRNQGQELLHRYQIKNYQGTLIRHQEQKFHH